MLDLGHADPDPALGLSIFSDLRSNVRVSRSRDREREEGFRIMNALLVFVRLFAIFRRERERESGRRENANVMNSTLSREGISRALSLRFSNQVWFGSCLS